jgi:hypothetical protein
VLGALRDPVAVDCLVHLSVYDPFQHARWRAIWGSSTMPHELVVDKLVTMLKNLTPFEQWSEYWWNAAVALGTAADPPADLILPVFAAGLNTFFAQNDFRIWEAVFVLAHCIDDTTVYDYLIDFWHAPENKSKISLRVLRELTLTIGKHTGGYYCYCCCLLEIY